MYIYRFIKRHQILEVILTLLTIVLAVVLIVYLIRLIPHKIDLANQWPFIKSAIKNFISFLRTKVVFFSQMVNITFGEKLTTIGAYAFYNCSNITSITLHNSIQTIEEYAFYNCSNLMYVYFYGTQEDWNSISIGNHNSCLTDATIVYK
jgi:hypothetical protein